MSDNCPICFDPFDMDLHHKATFQCGHTLCSGCSSKWYLHHDNCPICRRDIENPKEIFLTVNKSRLIAHIEKNPTPETYAKLTRMFCKLMPLKPQFKDELLELVQTVGQLYRESKLKK